MLRYLLRTAFRSYTGTTVMVLFNITVALFCTNVILGYAETYYRNGAGSTEYTVITLAGLDSETKTKDMLAELKKYKPSAAAYIRRGEDGAVLMGFDGSDQAGNWWPEGGGEFVNNCSSADYPNVVYLNAPEMMTRNLSIGSLFELDGKEYRIIGNGQIIQFNLNRLISKSSPQTVFDLSVSTHALDDPAGWFRVFPYQTFRESYEPELILVHFPKMNYGQILRMTDRLARMFPNCTVTAPKYNSNELYQYALQIMRRFIPLYVFLTEITVVLAVCELYKKLRTECFLCRLCGMSRRKLRRQLIAVVGVRYLLGSAAALLLQLALKGPLAKLSVKELPTAAELAAGVLAMYILSVLFSLPELLRGLRLQRTEEA